MSRKTTLITALTFAFVGYAAATQAVLASSSDASSEASSQATSEAGTQHSSQANSQAIKESRMPPVVVPPPPNTQVRYSPSGVYLAPKPVQPKITEYGHKATTKKAPGRKAKDKTQV